MGLGVGWVGLGLCGDRVGRDGVWWCSGVGIGWVGVWWGRVGIGGVGWGVVGWE